MADRRLFRFVHTRLPGGDEVTRLERKPLSSLNKDLLIATAEERGVKSTGTKDELLARLS